MKYRLLLLLGWLLPVMVEGQYPNHNLDQYPKEWNSRWITHPDIDKTAHQLIHFRKKINISQVPKQFIIHISGDNRYRLYVNGIEAGYGPQYGDLRHWRYETLDLAPLLKEGENIIAAEVMNWGVERSYGIISFKTGLLIQGHSPFEQVVNTNGNGWKVYQNQSLHEKTVHWIGGGEIVGGFYASNPTDSIVASAYPWGWKQLYFDDSQWKTPETIFSQPKTNAGAGHGWILQPRTTAIQVSRKEPFTKIVRTDVEGINHSFHFGSQPLSIPANSKRTILIDQGYVSMGYPKLTLSNGKNAIVRVKYSEALYDTSNHKGNRNEILNKQIKGISDVYVMDGGNNRTFQPIWFRTFRFIQLDIQTEDQPLEIENFHNLFAATEFPLIAKFETDETGLDQIWDICWHGLRLSAQDNLLSDLYYEQMQYVGDLRPHLMAWTALTGDLTYFKSAMEQFNNSRLPDGNVTSCYPLKATFVHPTYSLIWVDMLHDLMMWEGDKDIISAYTSEIQEVFDYYESLINQNGLVGKSRYHMFIDWYLPKGGNSRVNKDGNSAILTLNYAYTLNKAAEIMEWLGKQEKSLNYSQRAQELSNNVRSLCFDSQRGIYADDPEKTFYDQRASILAILCGAHSESESKTMMRILLDENTEFDSRANLFYYFYLFEAMASTGTGDFSQALQPWKDIYAMGLTATPEKRIEQHPRSEVHPWTAHPVYFYFRTALGIEPATPGFKTVAIKPNPGSLKFLKGSFPTQHGIIEFDLNFVNDKTKGSVTLPVGVTGTFTWQGEVINLSSGNNEI